MPCAWEYSRFTFSLKVEIAQPATMSYSSDDDQAANTVRNEARVQAVQENLQQISIQLGQPQDAGAIEQLYQTAQALLSHLSPEPLTLARVAGVLLVYQLPDTDPNEVKWFKSELQNCPDVESIEELIDSISRPDSL